MIFCAAGDPGGSRALLPVIQECERRGLPCSVLAHGYLGRELPETLRMRLVQPKDAQARIQEAGILVFGSSATDTLPLSLARYAQERAVPVAHILDNWSGYRKRLETDGLPMLTPDLYLVMDNAAMVGAEEEGVPLSCLRVVGHPGMAGTAAVLRRLYRQNRQAASRSMGCPHGFRHLVFINEPFREVLGDNVTAPGHPGFTEDSVLAALTVALAPYRDEIFLSVLPHPKQSAASVTILWESVREPLAGQVVSLPPSLQGRDILGAVDGAAGMTSILLYEAWLMGLPVLCLQPDCRLASLRRFAFLDGICYADNNASIALAVEKWLKLACLKQGVAPKPELAFHEQSPARIVECLLRTGPTA